MVNFEYANPTTVKDALALLGASWGEADILAGGTDLLTLMKEYLHQPKRVVNIKGIPALKGIAVQGNMLRIGATTTLDELSLNPAVRTNFPSLVQAALGVASPQIRNMGTVAGDLCQRPRCWYFRGGHGLLAKGENGQSLVPNGENKYHAIFGSGPAYFVSASSLAPALIALDAKVKVASAKGNREIAVAELFRAPNADGEREITLAPNELVTDILVPIAPGKNATYEVRHKQALDWPIVTASVSLKLFGGKVTGGSVVMGHVGPTPVRSAQAENLLKGKAITEAVATEVAEAALASATPLSQNSYKVHLAKVAVKRALLAAAGVKA